MYVHTCTPVDLADLHTYTYRTLANKTVRDEENLAGSDDGCHKDLYVFLLCNE